MVIDDILKELSMQKKDGVYFGPAGGYWSNLNREDNERFLKELPLLGSKKTVEKYFPEHFDVIFSPKRAGGLPLLNSGSGELIVDVGCMWGALTIPLARTGCNVVAIDQTLESILLLKQRLMEDNLPNVDVVCADLKKIGFKGSSVDKFVINGVLEWIPESGVIELKKYYGKRQGAEKKYDKSDPYDLQLKFLKGIYNGLKPDGSLYLAIENRYDIFNFFGMPDPHCSLRFITFLPRFLQNMVSKVFLGRPYINWTYSAGGLKKLLKEAGFCDAKISYAFPDYRSPEQILSKAGMGYYRPCKFRRAKNIFEKVVCYVIEDILFRRLKLTAFAPSFVVLAKR